MCNAASHKTPRRRHRHPRAQHSLCWFVQLRADSLSIRRGGSTLTHRKVTLVQHYHSRMLILHPGRADLHQGCSSHSADCRMPHGPALAPQHECAASHTPQLPPHPGTALAPWKNQHLRVKGTDTAHGLQKASGQSKAKGMSSDPSHAPVAAQRSPRSKRAAAPGCVCDRDQDRAVTSGGGWSGQWSASHHAS